MLLKMWMILKATTIADAWRRRCARVARRRARDLLVMRGDVRLLGEFGVSRSEAEALIEERRRMTRALWDEVGGRAR